MEVSSPKKASKRRREEADAEDVTSGSAKKKRTEQQTATQTCADVPRGFAGVRYDNEDLPVDHTKLVDEDVKLWLFRVPKSFDVRLLQNMPLKPGKEKRLTATDGTTYHVAANAKSTEMASYVALLPSSEDNKLHALRPFECMVNVERYITLPDQAKPGFVKKQVPPTPCNPKPHAPFGAEDPVKLSVDYKKIAKQSLSRKKKGKKKTEEDGTGKKKRKDTTEASPAKKK
eukprot:Colp12_sorted_trinity150504_noHs@20497